MVPPGTPLVYALMAPARLAFTMATFNVLVQGYGLQPNASGFVPLLIALQCGPPLQGQAKWTLQLLADQLVALHVVKTISYETVRQRLKKTSSSRPDTSAG